MLKTEKDLERYWDSLDPKKKLRVLKKLAWSNVGGSYLAIKPEDWLSASWNEIKKERWNLAVELAKYLAGIYLSKTSFKESISQALEGIPVSITCNATDYPSEAELIDDDGVIVCSNCWAPFFSSLDDDEMNEETKREFLFVHDVRGNINEQHRKYWIVSWESWDAYVGFTYPSKSFYNEEDADKFVEALKKNENNREILKYASTGIPSVPPIYKEEKELKKYDLIKKIRKPIPPQKHSIHKDKTKYDRKRDKKNIDEAQQYAAEGFDVEVECLKKNDFGYLVPWRSKYICSVCGIDSDWTHFMDFHKFFGGLTLNEQKTDRMNETDYELFEEWFSSLKEIDSLKKYYFKGRVSGVAKYLIEKYAFVKKWSHQKIESAISTFFETKKAFNEIVRKVGNEYVLYSKKKDPKTGKRRVLGREKSKEAIEKREAQVNYFKNKG